MQVISKRYLPLFDLGFRPFYLLAAFWSVIAIMEWLLELSGSGVRNIGSIPGIQWHAHEMIFGFAATVIVGFALTAVQSWTGLDTPKGFSLMLLAVLWIAGRLGPLVSPNLAIVDVLFLPTIAVVIGKLIVQRKMTRNLFLPLILSLLGLLNGLFYLSAYGRMNIDANTVLMASLFLIVMIEIMIGGRVIPSFTANAIAGLHQFKSKNLANITLICSASAFLLYIFSSSNYLTSIICFLAGCLQLILQWGWRPLATVSKPMVWVLHAAYGWMSLGFIFLGLSSLGILSVYIALHAFGIGATGGLIIGMITRTAMGHTGRKINAGYIEKTCYILVQLTAIIWMIAHVTTGVWFHATIGLAGVCWCLTFILYIFKYLPWLTRARFDEQAG
jgi:uncharacterized protein involved in response to NO